MSVVGDLSQQQFIPVWTIPSNCLKTVIKLKYTEIFWKSPELSFLNIYIFHILGRLDI